ncbi:hypothetical protein AB4Z25_14590 [Rhizobium sp. RAF36]|uniref:DUF6894 family protein n=1 Tax=Rhizobium sp. RAF36 TaxID=3233055 RepID=UPI003F9DDB95
MRYYFHIHEDAVYIEDVEGIDLPGGGEARNEAVKAAREMVAELVLSGEPIDGKTFEVRDEGGTLIATVPFLSVIK